MLFYVWFICFTWLYFTLFSNSIWQYGKRYHYLVQFERNVPQPDVFQCWFFFFSGIRKHFPHFINALTENTAGKAQLGLGHSYSRDKVKFNVNRVDNMIIQSISLLDQLDKDINTFSMRIRYKVSSSVKTLKTIQITGKTDVRTERKMKCLSVSVPKF